MNANLEQNLSKILMKKKHIKRFLQIIVSFFILTITVAFLVLTFYKKELSEILKKHLETKYGLHIEIENADVSLLKNWPNATMNFKNVTMTSLEGKQNNEPMFKANSIYLSFSLTKLLTKNFIVNTVFIEHAKINLIKDSLGSTNFKLIGKKEEFKNNSLMNFDIERLSLIDVKFDFHNKKKHIGILVRQSEIKISSLGEIVNAKISGLVHTNEFFFKATKGPFLYNKEVELSLSAHYYPRYSSVLVDTTSFAIVDGQQFSLVSFIDLTEKKEFTLQITGKNVDVKKGLTLLNSKIKYNLRNISVENPVEVDAVIISQIGKGQDPQMNIKITGKGNNFKIGKDKIPLDNVSFDAFVSSEADSGKFADFDNATVCFKNIKGAIYNCPFTGSIKIKNFNDPQIIIKANLLIDGAKAALKPGKDFVLNGFCLAEVSYSGSASCLNRNEFLNDQMNLTAAVYFHNFSYQTRKEEPAYILNGSASVSGTSLLFKKMELKTVGGSFLIDGKASGFVEYVCGLSNGFSASISANSSSFDLTPLILKSFQSGGQKKKPIDKNKLKKIEKSDFTFDISLHAKKFKIRHVNATDVSVEINYTDHIIAVKKLFMKTCEGTLEAEGNVADFSSFQAKVLLSNMDVKKMFEEFENFGQGKIVSKNIEGTISGEANLSSDLNQKFEVVPEAINGQIVVKINDGQLLNFEPFQNISNYIFRERDFDDITFSELDAKFLVEGTKMQINDLEIASSVLNMYINGTCDFKGESTINMRIPWNNLRKRGKNYVPVNKGIEGEDAKGLLLNYSGLPGKMKLGLGNSKVN
jgi:hypothetical protein